jgi:PII-like signaling protein
MTGETMDTEGPHKRLTIFVGEADRFGHHTVVSEIVQQARRAGLAGASVFRGIEGFGASQLLHTTRVLSMSEDLPVAIVIVDTEAKVREFLPSIDELVTGGLVLLDDVEVVKHVGRPRDHPT